jgi:hypothetical protein
MSDHIPKVKITPDGALIAIQQSDGLFSLSWLEYDRGELSELTQFARLPHRADVVDFAISLPHFLCVIITASSLIRYDIGTETALESRSITEKAHLVAIDDRAAQFVIAGHSKISIFSINGDEILTKPIKSSVTVISIPDLDEAAANRFIATGHANGSIAFWCIDLAVCDLIQLTVIELGTRPIAHIAFDEVCQRAAVASDAEIFTVEFRGSTAPDLKKELAVECCVCRTKTEPRSSRICSFCHRFFCRGCASEDAGPLAPAQCRQCAAIPH